MNEILGFFGDYRFLSNFYPSPIIFENRLYPSVEHAYAAAKTDDERFKQWIIREPSPGNAKKIGRNAPLKANWDKIRCDVMRDLLILKFSQEPFMSKLIATGDAYLEETNTWGDTFWGVCNGTGKNNLGKILMEIRADLHVIQSLSEHD